MGSNPAAPTTKEARPGKPAAGLAFPGDWARGDAARVSNPNARGHQRNPSRWTSPFLSRAPRGFRVTPRPARLTRSGRALDAERRFARQRRVCDAREGFPRDVHHRAHHATAALAVEAGDVVDRPHPRVR